MKQLSHKAPIAVNMADRCFKNHIDILVDDIKDKESKVVFLSTIILAASAKIYGTLEHNQEFQQHMQMLMEVIESASDDATLITTTTEERFKFKI